MAGSWKKSLWPMPSNRRRNLCKKEFDRDKKFLPALKESSEFLAQSFERMIAIAMLR